MLGETQILGQVSQAFASARSNGTSGPLLTYVFSRAAHAGKRARSETEISKGGTSSAMQPWPCGKVVDLSSRRILVAGRERPLNWQFTPSTNGATESVSIAPVERSDLALRYGCSLLWAVGRRIVDADAVITATGSPIPGSTRTTWCPYSRNGGAPLVFVDIAAPDVDLSGPPLPGAVLRHRPPGHLDQNLSRRWRCRRLRDRRRERLVMNGSTGRQPICWRSSMNTPDRSQTPSSAAPCASLGLTTLVQRSSRAWPTG
jgi:hypothetical protein